MNKEIITDEEIKKIIKFYYDSCDDFDYEREYTRKLEVYINQLKKKAELGEHYKHLYSEVKKQKDDVVEYIKYQLSNLDLEKDEDVKAKMLGSMILVMLEDNRMLGEKDVED